MTEAIKGNPIILRSCILYEFTEGKPIFETFKKLCKKFGDDFMDYPEFEYWFMRFAQGNFDVDHDRNLDPKTCSFTDLPVEIFEEIGGYLDLSERDSHENLLSLFKNPKLRLDKLAIQCSNRKKKEIKKLFERSNQKIRVRQLNIDEKFLQRPTILHVFDDEALKEVTVITDDEYIRILNEFDILKKLEMFTICTWRCPTDPTLLYNFPRLTIKYYNSCEEVEVSHFIKNLLQSTQLQVCFLSCLTYSVDMGLIKSYFVEPETMVPDLPNIRRYPIPATNEFYEIDFGEEEISIERKQ